MTSGSCIRSQSRAAFQCSSLRPSTTRTTQRSSSADSPRRTKSDSQSCEHRSSDRFELTDYTLKTYKSKLISSSGIYVFALSSIIKLFCYVLELKVRFTLFLLPFVHSKNLK